MDLHVVLGNGPAGAATARLLAADGHRVRVVSRSPRPAEPGIEHVTLDVTDAAALTGAVRDAAAIYNCACPPYPRWVAQWPVLAGAVDAAAEASGAVLVSLSNLYGYGPSAQPMTEDLPLAATSRKGRVRAAVWERTLARHEAGRIRAVEARAADFFGPGVTAGGHLAGRLVPPLLRGRTINTLGDPHTPHSWTYLPDVARALVRLAQEESAWGRAWHVPTAAPASVAEMAAALGRYAGAPPAIVRRTPDVVLRAGALVSPTLRELVEVRYQFDRPFIVDSTAYQQRFQDRPTPLAEQISTTVDWWRTRMPG